MISITDVKDSSLAHKVYQGVAWQANLSYLVKLLDDSQYRVTGNKLWKQKDVRRIIQLVLEKWDVHTLVWPEHKLSMIIIPSDEFHHQYQV